MTFSPYVSKLIIKDKNRQLKHVKGELRGARKRINKLVKVIRSNHDGLMYWKNKYEERYWKMKNEDIDFINSVLPPIDVLNNKKYNPVNDKIRYADKDNIGDIIE